MLLHARRAEPNPLTYLVALALGIGVGTLLDWWLGWWWWLVAVGFVALVWVLFLASAFGKRARGDLWVDLVRVVSPSRGEAMRYRKLARLAGRATFTIVGLPQTWSGDRSFGGYGISEQHGLTHLELAHGRPLEHPYVLVDSRGPGRDELDDAKRFLSRRLWEDALETPEFPTAEALHEWHEQRNREFEQTPEPPWNDMSIACDGTLHRFETRAQDDRWVAVGALGDTVVALEVGGLDPDQVSLVTIEDFEPYIEGSITKSESMRHPRQA